MKIRLQYVFIIIGVFLLSSTANASDKKVLEAVKAMEQKYGVKVTGNFDLANSVRTHPQNSDTYFSRIEISPDGATIAWWLQTLPDLNKKIPILTVYNLKAGNQPVQREIPIIANYFGISNDAEIIIARAYSYPVQRDSHWELLAIDPRSGLVIYNLTRFVREFQMGDNLEDIIVSGEGKLVAVSTRDYIQVIEIPSGNTMFTGAGRFPRLSPDGKRLAFVNKEKLWIHTFANNSTEQLPIKRVKGIGGWSPDGQFLLAGAWTRPMFLAWEKRKIVIDTATGEYAVIGTLGEGDYGTHFAWISTKLLAANPQHL